MHYFKSRKILIPDVPPPTINTARPGLMVAGIGVVGVTLVIALLIFVF
jgi:hypothetical protein